MPPLPHDALSPQTETSNGSGPRRKRRWRRDAAAEATRDVSFSDLVQTRYAWYEAVRGGNDPGELNESYTDASVQFQARHGVIVEAYWAHVNPSAVALTRLERPHRFLRRRFVFDFHRVTDWATRHDPETSALLHECEFLAIQMGEVLRGTPRRIALRLVMSTACRLLAIIDASADREPSADGAPAAAPTPERRKLATELKMAWAYYRVAAQGIARMDYTLGMVGGLVLLTGIALGIGFGSDLPSIDDREFFGCLVAGTLGAIVSVISRIAAGHRINFEFDVGRTYILFLGSLRPLIGAIFGLAIYFAVVSGIVDLFAVSPDGTARFYFLLVIAFLAGFSERFARDALLGPTRSVADEPPASQVKAAALELTREDERRRTGL